jgi:hypothetical protein
MQSFWNVVQIVCMVVGAWTLLAALFASVWTALVRGRREGTGARPAYEHEGRSAEDRPCR